jgi:NADPH-dependent 2,4-dienoyl-CoA reductase/sulfur reductase-like enzyme
MKTIFRDARATAVSSRREPRTTHASTNPHSGGSLEEACMKADVKELRADIAIIGGGLGGCAAVLAAASLGRRVIRTEATQWLGGQLTSQAVPPDEHRWIETFGATASYRNLRRLLRSADRRRVVVSIHQRA